MDPKTLFANRKYNECYSFLVNKNTHDIGELELLFECAKVLKLYKFDDWKFDLYVKSLSLTYIKSIYKELNTKISINQKMILLNEMFVKGDMSDTQKAILKLLDSYLDEKNYGVVRKLISQFDPQMSQSIIYQILKLRVGIYTDYKNSEQVTKTIESSIDHKWKSHREQLLNDQQVKKLIIDIDKIEQTHNTELYKKFQTLKYKLVTKCRFEVSRESFLQSAVFFVESEKKIKHKENIKTKKNTIIKPQENYNDTGEYKEGVREELKEEKSLYKPSLEEEEILLRIKHGDQSIIDNCDEMIRVFFNLEYFQAIMNLEEKLNIRYSINTIAAMWKMNKFIDLISYCCHVKSVDEDLEALYYLGRAWDSIGNNEQAFSTYSKILKKDATYRDVRELVKNV